MHRGSAATPVANSDQTVGNVLRRHGIPPAPKRGRTTTWAEFIRAHLAVLTGTDFFAVEVLTWRGLVTYYVLFFLTLPGSPIIRPSTGCNKWPGTRLWKDAAPLETAAISFTIVTRSTQLPSWQSLSRCT